ncbi:MAG TPA: BON domain-containing protein [Desulfobacterales bacterium]
MRISGRDGVVHLQGVLPAENSRRRLREIIENVLDFKKVDDRLAIDRTLWEQRKRSRGRSAEAQKKEDETLMEGERTETDPFAAMADGKPMAPPDTLQPEKKK